MPKVPQSLPASNSQKRDSSEKRGFLQLCASGAVMVMMTGATAGAVEGAETCGAGVTAGKLLCCWVAQASKQRKRAMSSVVALHCNQPSAGDEANGSMDIWPLAQVDKALPATKTRVNLKFIVASMAVGQSRDGLMALATWWLRGNKKAHCRFDSELSL